MGGAGAFPFECVALDTFAAESSDDLGFRKGDVITAVSEVDDMWWRGENKAGRAGIFPASFVERVAHEEMGLDHGGSSGAASGAGAGDTMFPCECVALDTFLAESSEDLGFRKGDMITALDAVDDLWWRGRGKGGKVGIFPMSFVERTEPAEAPAGDDGGAGGFPCKCRALDTFVAETDEDLGFRQGEMITALGEVDEMWWRGENEAGRAGIFPASFVERVVVGTTHCL